jgi:hypothetical protein
MTHVRRRASVRWSLATSALAAVVSIAVSAQTPAPRDIDVKATYLLNFGRFVKWPPAALPASAALNICVLGTDPFGAVLDRTLAGEVVDGHKAVARRLTKPDEIAGCHMLFVAADRQADVPVILRAVGSTPVLTVSDVPGFSRSGGMIGLVSNNSRVRFEINLDASSRAGLTLSSELARLALNIRRGTPQQP